MKSVLTLFGTRPEIIKLAPVLRALDRRKDRLRAINVSSSQHTDLLHPLLSRLRVRMDHDLAVMRPGQSPIGVCQRVLGQLDPLLETLNPDLLVVQGDTTTTLAGAMAAFHRRIPVAHVEAGLRSGDRLSPFPEEMNRRLVTQLASLHLPATQQNRSTLLREGICKEDVVVTGNPGIDSLVFAINETVPSERIVKLLDAVRGLRVIALTTHRRESFGELLAANLRVLRQFVKRHQDLALVFPVHPNPHVREQARSILEGANRIWLVDPIEYFDFIHLLAHSWLIVSDSGGIQEETPTLGRPLLILRENTERSEAVECGVARLVGGDPVRLEAMLEEAHHDASWAEHIARTENPFGQGDSGPRIIDAIESYLERNESPDHVR